VAAAAQQAKPAIELTVRTDRPEAIYKPGENATFRIQAKKEGAALGGATLSVVLFNDGHKSLGPSQTVTLDAEGNGTVAGTLSGPGFLQCQVVLKNGEQSTAALGGAAFDPEKIQPTAKEPADFDSFWAAGKKELAAVPVDARLTPSEKFSLSTTPVYKINLANVGNSRVWGWLAVPKKETPLPAVLVVPGAGVYGQGPAMNFARAGALTLNISVHDMDVDLPQADYDTANNGPLKGYPQHGKTDREKFYYHRVVLGCVRALDYLTSRPEWDKKHLVVAGSSQGGALSLITAGVDSRVTALSANVPAMCDHTGYTVDRVSGWPQLGERGRAADLEAVTRTSAYYDAVNFARKFKGPALVGVGFVDRTCPPTTVYAAYNSLGGPKEIVNSPSMGHSTDPRFTKRQEEFLKEHWAK
ncbi:MAG: acetyl xylan esterase, partial [Armatimonadetes bacterium]|nr:acetyl xylan esterase [Armatimonadota bacterium]